jgi:hypothetical protein
VLAILKSSVASSFDAAYREFGTDGSDDEESSQLSAISRQFGLSRLLAIRLALKTES